MIILPVHFVQNAVTIPSVVLQKVRFIMVVPYLSNIKITDAQGTKHTNFQNKTKNTLRGKSVVYFFAL